MNGNFPEAISAALVLFVAVFGAVVGVIIYHAVAYRAKDMDEAPGITISRPEEHDRAGV